MDSRTVVPTMRRGRSHTDSMSANLSPLEPLVAQQRHEEVDEQQQGDDGGEEDHGCPFIHAHNLQERRNRRTWLPGPERTGPAARRRGPAVPSAVLPVVTLPSTPMHRPCRS